MMLKTSLEKYAGCNSHLHCSQCALGDIVGRVGSGIAGSDDGHEVLPVARVALRIPDWQVHGVKLNGT